MLKNGYIIGHNHHFVNTIGRIGGDDCQGNLRSVVYESIRESIELARDVVEMDRYTQFRLKNTNLENIIPNRTVFDFVQAV